jgi:hypothetical protein
LKEEFINELVTLFAGNNPPDDKGYIHFLMVRLEIELILRNKTFRFSEKRFYIF